MMLLWNECEGKRVGGRYLLGPLMGSEGRTALFAGAEEPVVVALTESPSDEGRMLAYWKRIAAFRQENLLEMKDFGRAEVEGTSLVYVAVEGFDGVLADLLQERVLTREEAVQIAVSLVGALGEIHRAGMAHGQVTAENVVAVGETVKLRTDVMREFGERVTEEEWADLRWKDVQGLALVLLRGLTLERKLGAETRLEAPFDRVVEKGINGSWGLAEILEAVTSPVVEEPVVVPMQYSLPVVEETPVEAELPLRRVEEPAVEAGGFDKRLLGVGVGLLVLVLVGVHFFRGKPEVKVTAPVAVAAPSVVSAPAAVAAEPAMKAGWYAIAYTYNREDQAAKKAATINRLHPELAAGVVAPGGHGPYLVALGGAMSRDGAEKVREKALREGLPRDTFVRNYHGS